MAILTLIILFLIFIFIINGAGKKRRNHRTGSQIVRVESLYTEQVKKNTDWGIFWAVVLFPLGILIMLLMKKTQTLINCELTHSDGSVTHVTLEKEEFFNLKNLANRNSSDAA